MNNEDLSNAIGWVSIACWMVVYTPQYFENYRLKSGEGLSVPFVIIWLLGDVCNLLGALMARLQGTVIILAGYYLACDVSLLLQILYYRRIHPGHFNARLLAPEVYDSSEIGENTPFLNKRDVERVERSMICLRFRASLCYALAVAFVAATGIIAWLVTGNNGFSLDLENPKDVIGWKSQLLGWISALLYLGARVPQIIKNFTTKCEGLSLALFLFAIAGNVTYVASICAESTSPQHLIANASWLAGSGLTVFLDIIVLCQFFYYRGTEGGFVSKTLTLVDGL